VRIDDLLTIDVAAELRKLTGATLEGSWQVPAELVRRALLAGASRITVELGRPLVVRDDGEPLAPTRQRLLLTVLDERSSAVERHQALVDLEDDPGLLAVAAARPAAVRFEQGRSGGTTVVVGGARLDAAAARRWLQTCARFAPAEVTVDGAVVTRGFGEALLDSPLEAPLDGRLALTPGGETAHLWLLLGGVVTAHLTLPDAPAFEAAIEMSGSVKGRSPAALREAIQPHVAALTDQAVRLLLRAASHERDEERHRHVRLQLLAAARLGIRAGEIFAAPLYRTLEGPAARAGGRASLRDLQDGWPLPCLDPGDDPAGFLLPPGPVLVVDAEERGRLARLLGARFRPLTPRRMDRGFGARWRRALSRGAETAREVASRVRHPGSGRVVSEAALPADERRLLRALREAMPGTRLALTDGGGGRPRRVEGGLGIPRRHPDVARAAALVARDPSWAYPAALALLDGVEPPDEAAVEAWRARRG
jgi:hypothetical protein